MNDRSSFKKLLVIADQYPSLEEPVRGIFVRDHVKAILPWVEEVHVLDINLTGSPISSFTDPEFSNIHITQGGIRRKKPSSLKKLTAYLNWKKKATQIAREFPEPDLIHAHGTILSGNLARDLSGYFKKPYLITEHFGSFADHFKDPLKKRMVKRAYGKASHLLTASQYLLDIIRERTDVPPSRVIHNPIDTELFQPQKGKSTDGPILFCSRLDPAKGGLRTLEAFDRIKEAFPDRNLLIAGEGREKEAIEQKLSQNEALRKRVEIRDKLTRKEIRETMGQSCMLVAPSAHESFGMVMAEGVASGIPVIGPNRTGPLEFLSEETGKLVDPMSVEGISIGMKELLEDLDKFEPEKLHLYIKGRFSPEIFGKNLMSIYERMIPNEE